MLARGRQRTCRNRPAARDVREVGTKTGASGRRPNGVAHDTRPRHEDVVPPLLLVMRRLRRAAALPLDPLLELLHRLGDDEERHMGVLVATELGALSPI